MKHQMQLLSLLIRLVAVSLTLLLTNTISAKPESKLGDSLAPFKNAKSITVYAISEGILFNNAVLPNNVRKFAKLEFTFATGSQDWNAFWDVAARTSFTGGTTPGDFRWALFATSSAEHQTQILAVDRTARVMFVNGQFASARGPLFKWLRSLRLQSRVQK